MSKVLTHGFRHTQADKLPRIDMTCDDETHKSCLSNEKYNAEQTFDRVGFERLKCEGCGGTMFEVLYTNPYETTAHCPCGLYFTVHTG